MKTHNQMVIELLHSLHKEQITINACDCEILKAYANNSISERDLMMHFTQFPDLNSYCEWINSRVTNEVDEILNKNDVSRYLIEILKYKYEKNLVV